MLFLTSLTTHEDKVHVLPARTLFPLSTLAFASAIHKADYTVSSSDEPFNV